MSPAVDLPSEILLRIFGWVAATGSLKEVGQHLARCTLVSRAWVECARDVMYRNISIRLWPSPTSHPPSLILQPARAKSLRLGLRSSSPFPTLLAHPHLARRVRGLDFDFLPLLVTEESYRNAGLKWEKLEDSQGYEHLREACHFFFNEVMETCTTLSDIYFLYGPLWAMEGLTDSLLEHDIEASRIGKVILALRPEAHWRNISKEMLDLFLQFHRLRKLSTDTFMLPEELESSPPLAIQLESLELGATVPESLHILSANSQSSLTRLKIEHLVGASLDLSLFTSLVSIDLTVSMAYDPPNLDYRAYLPRWTPPASSSLRELALQPIWVHAAALPPVPSSVEHLTLGLETSWTNIGLLVPPPNSDSAADYPVFALIVDLVRSRKSLRRLELAVYEVWPTGLNGYSDVARGKLVTACRECGVSLEDRIATELNSRAAVDGQR